MTNKLLAQYFELHDSLSTIKEKVDEMVKTVQDQQGHIEHEITRDKKKVKLTERVLWEEIYYFGFDSDAGKILRKKYPDIFETIDKSNAIAQSIKMFELKNLGFEFSQMNGARLIELVNYLIDSRYEKGNQGIFSRLFGKRSA